MIFYKLETSLFNFLCNNFNIYDFIKVLNIISSYEFMKKKPEFRSFLDIEFLSVKFWQFFLQYAYKGDCIIEFLK